MENKNINEFAGLVNDLESLKKIKAGRELKYRINHILLPNLPERKSYFYAPLFALRPLALAILILIFAGGGVVLASKNSKPGDFLYPVKTAVASIVGKSDKDNVSQKEITPTPSVTDLPRQNNSRLNRNGTLINEVAVPPKAGLSPTDENAEEIEIEIDSHDIKVDPVKEPKKPLPGVKEIIPTTVPPRPTQANPNHNENKATPTTNPDKGILPPVTIKLPIVGNLNIGL